MILSEPTETRDREIHVGAPQNLSVLIGISRAKICCRVEEIDTAETIWHVGSQPDPIHTSTKLPEVFALRAGIRVATLIVIFAAFAVPSVRTPERDESSDFDRRVGLYATKRGVW